MNNITQSNYFHEIIFVLSFLIGVFLVPVFLTACSGRYWKETADTAELISMYKTAAHNYYI